MDQTLIKAMRAGLEDSLEIFRQTPDWQSSLVLSSHIEQLERLVNYADMILGPENPPKYPFSVI